MRRGVRHMTPTRIDMAGQQIGAFHVVGFAGYAGRAMMWVVQCDAGHRFTARGQNLRKAQTGRWEIRCPGCVAA